MSLIGFHRLDSVFSVQSRGVSQSCQALSGAALIRLHTSKQYLVLPTPNPAADFQRLLSARCVHSTPATIGIRHVRRQTRFQVPPAGENETHGPRISLIVCWGCQSEPLALTHIPFTAAGLLPGGDGGSA